MNVEKILKYKYIELIRTFVKIARVEMSYVVNFFFFVSN